MSVEHKTVRQTDRQKDRQTDSQKDRLTDRQIGGEALSKLMCKSGSAAADPPSESLTAS